MVKRLPLSNSGKEALVDDDVFDWIRSFGDWQLVTIKYTDYVYKSVGGRTVYLHRMIMEPPCDLVVDHVDGDGLNNCRKNLRVVTGGINNINSKVLRNDNLSGKRGVSWDDRTGKWRATITLRGKQRNLGRFSSREDAIKARINAENEIYASKCEGGEPS